MIWYQCLFSECICYQKDKKGFSFHDKLGLLLVCFFLVYFLFSSLKSEKYAHNDSKQSTVHESIPRSPDPVDLLLFLVRTKINNWRNFLWFLFPCLPAWLFFSSPLHSPHPQFSSQSANSLTFSSSIPWMNERTKRRWWKDLFRRCVVRRGFVLWTWGWVAKTVCFACGWCIFSHLKNCS